MVHLGDITKSSARRLWIASHSEAHARTYLSRGTGLGLQEIEAGFSRKRYGGMGKRDRTVLYSGNKKAFWRD